MAKEGRARDLAGLPEVRPKKVDGAEACVRMHTALRKICDSKITSAAYNLVHLIADRQPAEVNGWRIFGNLVAGNLERNLDPPAAVRAALGALDGAYEEAVGRWRAPEKGASRVEGDHARVALLALRCTFQCFDDADLHGVAGYLAE